MSSQPPATTAPLPRPRSPLSLPHLIQPAPDNLTDETPEDIIASALSLLDPFAATNQHGEPGGGVLYNARDVPPLQLKLSDPGSASERWLFAHYVWNAGLLLAECITKGWWWQCLPESARTRSMECDACHENVLELGSGSGLVGLCAAKAGASAVTLTDYPAPKILKTLKANVIEYNRTWGELEGGPIGNGQESGRETLQPTRKAATSEKPNGKNGKKEGTAVVVEGHEWGCFETEWASSNRSAFSCVLAADTLWLDSAHAAQAASMAWFLERSLTARVWVVAGFHNGRAKVRHFLEESIPEVNLVVLEAWEVDVVGEERTWEALRPEGLAEGSRWCVVAVIGWSGADPGDSKAWRS